MTLLEIIEKQKEEQKIKELALSQKITKEEASWRYYKGSVIKSIFENPAVLQYEACNVFKS